MTNDQIIAKLDKTAKSLRSHVNRGNTPAGMRSMELIDRYGDLRNKALATGVWAKHCESHSYDFNHDAYDFFA